MPRTVVDYRLGGDPIWRIVPDAWEGFVRLPDETQRCVVFLGYKERDRTTGVEKTVYGGTAFFVGLTLDNGVSLICLVTARHCAREIEHGAFCIRANTWNGEAREYWLDAGVDAEWIYHPTDDTVDAAVLLWLPPDEVDFKCIPTTMFLDNERIRAKRIGVGDETFITGLFKFVAGRGKNLPIVRTGSIAMMPDERIPAPKWHKRGVEGYLVETRSTTGLSGSPVFVQRSIEVQATEETGRTPLAAGALFWLGLVHGHWDVGANQVDAVHDDREKDAINAGIAIVVPTPKILEMLYQPSIIGRLRNAAEEFESQYPALMDGCSPASVEKGNEREAAMKTTAIATKAASKERAKHDRPLALEMGTSAGPVFSPSLDFARRKAIPTEPAKGEQNPSHKEDFTSLLSAAATKKRPSE